jgi:serine/threonine protein kinase
MDANCEWGLAHGMSAASDAWAVGCVAFFTLTGEALFKFDDPSNFTFLEMVLQHHRHLGSAAINQLGKQGAPVRLPHYFPRFKANMRLPVSPLSAGYECCDKHQGLALDVYRKCTQMDRAARVNALYESAERDAVLECAYSS